MQSKDALWRVSIAASLLIVLGATSCQTTKSAQPRYAWEIAQEAEYTTVFRGRWWNYYDRGLWHQLRGDYLAAERDLQSALDGRASDQYWPRTYGMHFLPEYFPNRELGITLYQLERYDESKRLLEASLEQQPSARAAHYADLARRAVITRDGSDQSNPTVRIVAQPTKPIAEMYTTIRIAAEDDQFIKEVYVNGEPYDIRVSSPSVEFDRDLVLGPGANTVEVRAVDLMGKEATEEFSIATDLDGPAVSFIRYEPGTRMVQGVAFDTYGIDRIEVGGVQAQLVPESQSTSSFTAILAPPVTGDSVNYAAVDSVGNVTRGTVLLEGPTGIAMIPGRPRTRYAAAALDVDEFRLARPELDSGAPSISIQGIDDGQQYFQNTVVTNLRVDPHGERIERIVIRDDRGENSPQLPPGFVDAFDFSTRIDIGTDEREINLQVDLDTQDGKRVSDSRRISRLKSSVETAQSTLSFALVYAKDEHSVLTQDQVDEFFIDLRLEKAFDARFGSSNWTPVASDKFVDARTNEAIINKDAAEEFKREFSGAVVLPDLFVVGKIRDYSEAMIEVVLEGYTTHATPQFVFRVDVVTEFESDRIRAALDRCRDLLAVRLAQEFPRVQERVIAIKGSTVDVALRAEQGIRRYFSCVLFERDPTESIRDPYEAISQGWIDVVNSRYASKARMINEDALPVDLTGREFFVIMK